MLLNVRRLFAVLFVLLFISIGANSAAAQPTKISGLMSLKEPVPDSYVPSVFPGMTFVNYSADPSSGECTVSFAGMHCLGKLDSDGTCSFNSEDCGGPKGWQCYFYRRSGDEEYGDAYGIKCTFPGDRRLNFEYIGSTDPDLTGGSLSTN